MPLPPKGSPQRPLRLAIRSTRSLGVLFLLLGGCASVPLFVSWGGGSRGGPPTGARVILSLLFYLGPGALYLLCSVFLSRRRFWALITAMAMAGIQILGLGVALIGILAFPPPRERTWFIWTFAGIIVILLVALAQLEYYLARSFEAIRQPMLDEQRGFEPLPAIPSMPSAAAPAAGGPHGPPS